MGNDGIIVADASPEVQGKVTWLKILPDGSREWYEQDDGSWSLVKSEVAPAGADHSHPTHGDIDFTGSVSTDGVEGFSGRITSFTRLDVSKGIIVGVVE